MKDIRGEAIPHPDATEEKPQSFLLKDAVLFALTSDADAVSNKDGDRKYRRFMLSQRIYNGETDISSKELTEIEELLEACALRTEVGGAARALLQTVGKDKSNAKSGS